MKRLLLAALLIPSITFAGGRRQAAKEPEAEGKLMFVSSEVADLRAKPGRHIGRYIHDPDQETQLLRGEPVYVLKRDREWAFVQSPQQQEFTHNSRWEGYPGWVEFSALTDDPSAELRLVPAPGEDGEIRKAILDQARRHLGTSYLWGGRSLHNPSDPRQVTGVDCSGLVNWAFRQTGRIVPRDAHEQFLRARPLTWRQLREGDLVFLATAERPDRVVHVGFYSGAGKILEAPQSGEAVRELTIEERFGKPLNELYSGQKVGDRVIYFGTLLDQP